MENILCDIIRSLPRTPVTCPVSMHRIQYRLQTCFIINILNGVVCFIFQKYSNKAAVAPEASTFNSGICFGKFTTPYITFVASLSLQYVFELLGTVCLFLIIVFLFTHTEMSEELRGLQEMARKFAREEIMPVVAEHDRTGEVKYFDLWWCISLKQLLESDSTTNLVKWITHEEVKGFTLIKPFNYT